MKKLTKELLNDFARKTCSPLKKWAAEILIDAWDDYENPKYLIKDMMTDAVMNGNTNLIYNRDFEEFYETNKIEISIALGFLMEEIGEYSPHRILKDWDKTDPLAVSTTNKILLCAFAFQYALEYLLNDLNIDTGMI